MSKEILYNDYYGAFSIPKKALLELFTRYPPYTKEGKKFFKPSKNIDLNGYKIIGQIDNKYTIFENKRTKYWAILHNENSNVYELNKFDDIFEKNRDCKELIQVLKDLNMLNVNSDGSLLKIYEIPEDAEYKITEYDGKETVHIIYPYREIIEDLLNIILDNDIKISNDKKLNIISQKILKGEFNIKNL